MAALLWILVIVAGIVFVPWERFTDELTVYPAMCIEKGRSAKTCPGFIPLGRTVYKIELGSTEVVSWRLDSDQANLTRLKNCAILSSRNWSCKGVNGAGKVAVKAGLRKRTGAERKRGIVHLYKAHWWLMKFAGGTTFRQNFLLPKQFD